MNEQQSGSLRQHINQQIADGLLSADRAQDSAIEALDHLLVELSRRDESGKKSALGWLFGSRAGKRENDIEGLYIWGGVGRGKSLLMDTFFSLAGTSPKKRVHFHAFMQDVHARIHLWRKGKVGKKDADPIPPLAKALVSESRLLCFDEFSVTDVADAMILSRLFSALFDLGVIIVATSNVAPDDLYKNGLNRSWFMPFIDLTKTRMNVVHLDSPRDHRLEKLSGNEVWFEGEGAIERFSALWAELTENLTIAPATLKVSGRMLEFDQTCGGILYSTFDHLCRKAHGAADYLAIAARFHTVFIENIPVLELADRNAAKRFITLIDTLYEARATLIVLAEAVPDQLYPVTSGTEAFEFARTISRLQEMQGENWLEQARRTID